MGVAPAAGRNGRRLDEHSGESDARRSGKGRAPEHGSGRSRWKQRAGEVSQVLRDARRHAERRHRSKRSGISEIAGAVGYESGRAITQGQHCMAGNEADLRKLSGPHAHAARPSGVALAAISRSLPRAASKLFRVGDTRPERHFHQSDGCTLAAFRAAVGAMPAAAQSRSNSMMRSDMNARVPH